MGTVDDKLRRIGHERGRDPESKAEKVLDLMKRKEGATLAEIAKETDSQKQKHSIRGFVNSACTAGNK